MTFTKATKRPCGRRTLLGGAVFLACLLLLAAERPACAQASLRVDGKVDELCAELSGKTWQGGFRPDWLSSSQYAAAVFAQGRKSVGKAVFEGSFSFDLSYGKAMSGSMMIHPGLFPLDVLEFTPGDKTLRSYAFYGGIGVEVAPRWLLGAKISFRSEDYSKRKDIRHTNFGLLLDVEPTVAWLSPEGLFLQLGVRYRRLYEQIKAERLGAETAVSYYAFLDKGLSYGAYQLWDGDGIHLNESGVNVLPLKDDALGLTLELRKDGWLARLGALRTNGGAGEKGYNWFRFPGWEAEALLQYETKSDRFSLQGAFDTDRLEESVMEKKSSGGVVIPEIYGWNAVSRRTRADARLEWTRRWAPGTNGARWEMDLSFEENYQYGHSFLNYPYTDRYDLWKSLLSACGKVHTGAFEVRLGLAGAVGFDQEQGLLSANPAVTSVPPYRQQEHWNAVKEYEKVPRATLNAGLNWYIPAVKGLYLRGDVAYTQAFGVQYLPASWRVAAQVGIGYTLKYQ